MPYNTLIAYTDGAARGNPGPAGAGAYIIDDSGSVVAELTRYLGEATNNVAEYQALLLALEELSQHQVESVVIRADSQLMIRQLQGLYKVKNEGLKPLYQQAKTQLANFSEVSLEHVRREMNKDADRLANQAIDER